MNMLDKHSTALKKIVSAYSRPIIFKDLTGTEYPELEAIFNDVEHILKIENLVGDPMGERSVLYIDRDSLNTAGIMPVDGWEAYGSPNSFDAEKSYVIEIPKQDRQLPGLLMFLTEIVDTAEEWPKVTT